SLCSVPVPRSVSAFFFFSSRRRHTRFSRDWSSDVCSSDLSPATALASKVLPVPGGPTSKTPFGAVPPSLVYFSGSFRKSTISTRSEERRGGKEESARVMEHPEKQKALPM